MLIQQQHKTLLVPFQIFPQELNLMKTVVILMLKLCRHHRIRSQKEIFLKLNKIITIISSIELITKEQLPTTKKIFYANPKTPPFYKKCNKSVISLITVTIQIILMSNLTYIVKDHLWILRVLPSYLILEMNRSQNNNNNILVLASYKRRN